MGNGTFIRNFDCLTAGSESMSRDIGALLPSDNSLTGDVGALEAIVANIGKLAGLRHQVQLAAERAWPRATPVWPTPPLQAPTPPAL
jgi:hypothetical protein